jgi:hypothetical protein
MKQAKEHSTYECSGIGNAAETGEIGGPGRDCLWETRGSVLWRELAGNDKVAWKDGKSQIDDVKAGLYQG